MCTFFWFCPILRIANLWAFSIIRFKPLHMLPYYSPAGRKTMGFGCHVRFGNGVVAERAQLIDDFVSFFVIWRSACVFTVANLNESISTPNGPFASPLFATVSGLFVPEG